MNRISSLGSSPPEIGSGLAMRNKNLHRNRDEDDRRKSDVLTVEAQSILRRDVLSLWETPTGGTIYRRGKPPPSRTSGKVHLTTADLPSSCDISGDVKACKGEEGEQ